MHDTVDTNLDNINLLATMVIKEMCMRVTHFEKVSTCFVILKQSVGQLQKLNYFLIWFFRLEEEEDLNFSLTTKCREINNYIKICSYKTVKKKHHHQIKIKIFTLKMANTA